MRLIRSIHYVYIQASFGFKISRKVEIRQFVSCKGKVVTLLY